jgi:hypothetical protein
MAERETGALRLTRNGKGDDGARVLVQSFVADYEDRMETRLLAPTDGIEISPGA